MEFKLRPGVKFHDGSELTAADVVYSFAARARDRQGAGGGVPAVLKPQNVTAPDKFTVQFRARTALWPVPRGDPDRLPSSIRAWSRPHEKNGDWGAPWLASNEAGSGAYQLIPETYRPLERVDLEQFDEPLHRLGATIRSPVQVIAFRPTQETSTRVLGLLNGSIDMTDSYLPTDQVEQIQTVQDRARREEHVDAHLHHPHEQHQAAVRQHQRPQMLRARLQLHRLHPGHPEGLCRCATRRRCRTRCGASRRTPRATTTISTRPRRYFDKAMAEGAPMKRPIEIHIQTQLEQTNAGRAAVPERPRVGRRQRRRSSATPGPTSRPTPAKPETTPDMWVHWVSTYFVDPENWIGQMYDSQFHGTWKASCLVQEPQGRRAAAQGARDLVEQAERAAAL